jgi:hypothetical protein
MLATTQFGYFYISDLCLRVFENGVLRRIVNLGETTNQEAGKTA